MKNLLFTLTVYRRHTIISKYLIEPHERFYSRLVWHEINAKIWFSEHEFILKDILECPSCQLSEVKILLYSSVSFHALWHRITGFFFVSKKALDKVVCQKQFFRV